MRGMLVFVIAMALGCAGATPAAVAPTPTPTLAPTPSPAPDPFPISEVPERDPAARGPLVSFAGELPDDRDGDGVADVIDLCPEIPADRMDGCLPRR